jgi:RecQ mediated genome instability protein
MIMQDACTQLQEIAGVRPSRAWLSQQAGVVGADDLLQQILYQDLRHVVREDREPAAIDNHQAQQWRRILQSHQDMRNNNNNHLMHATMLSTLPESFKLMIQIEEVVDVAQATEARLGNASAAAGNNRGQQQSNLQQRCLKLCITDGYHDNPQPQPQQQPRQQQHSNIVMMAMEVSAIPSLSANTPAGAKMVLHGPIPVRWGVLLLHQGNALVLGGSVARLVELQSEALADAKKLAGVGVDPTVRALVWNPDMGDDEGNVGSCSTRSISCIN